MSILELFRPSNQGWRVHDPWGAVRDANGNVLNCKTVMRRRVNGEWQYRAMTTAEALDQADMSSW